MTKDNTYPVLSPAFNAPVNESKHIMVSSGGVVTVLGGIGVIAACDIAKVKYGFLGGVSGGSIVTAIHAMGFTPKEMMQLGIYEDFSNHVSVSGGIFGSIGEVGRVSKAARQLLKHLRSGESAATEVAEETWHATGLLGTVGLGEFLKAKAREKGLGKNWPAGYWTMATTSDGSQVVFAEKGVFVISPQGQMKKICDKPAPLWLAVRASAAIPVIMTAIEFEGMLLFDGAMSRDGLCPAPMLIRHFGVDPTQIIACRCGEDYNHVIFGPTQRAVRKIWGIDKDYHWGPEGTGVIDFRPQIDHLHALKFELSEDEKWLAIIIAFHSCLESLAFNGLLVGEQLHEAQQMMKELGYWRDVRPAGVGEIQLLAPRASAVFAEHGLF